MIFMGPCQPKIFYDSMNSVSNYDFSHLIPSQVISNFIAHKAILCGQWLLLHGLFILFLFFCVLKE